MYIPSQTSVLFENWKKHVGQICVGMVTFKNDIFWISADEKSKNF